MMSCSSDPDFWRALSFEPGTYSALRRGRTMLMPNKYLDRPGSSHGKLTVVRAVHHLAMLGSRLRTAPPRWLTAANPRCNSTRLEIGRQALPNPPSRSACIRLTDRRRGSTLQLEGMVAVFDVDPTTFGQFSEQ